MKTPLEQSRAYAELGMLEEALALAEECPASGGDYDVHGAWHLRLAYRSRDFPRVVTLGMKLLARGRQSPDVRAYTALGMHHRGWSRQAAELLLTFEEEGFDKLESYLTACFLSATGEWNRAVRHLLNSLPGYRTQRSKTWLDGDLKKLWHALACGEFPLCIAHLLVESEFDILRAWQPGRDTEWELDPQNYDDLPPELKEAVRFDTGLEAYVPDYSKAPAGSQLAAQFERWAREEVSASQRCFDRARSTAWEQVLDAQPRYAALAWERGDLCAARNHVMWSAENDPARIMDFLGVPGIRPLVEEMWMMVESDWDFFAKLKTAFDTRETQPHEALETLDDPPYKWQTHPLVEHIRSFCLASAERPQESLACSLRVCAQWPDDAAPFLRAMGCARDNGWKESAAIIQAAAPAAAQQYRIWWRTSAFVNGTAQPELPPIRQFRGQPDLGGTLITEEDESLRSRTGQRDRTEPLLSSTNKYHERPFPTFAPARLQRRRG
jgi:hypothetical protein